MATEPNMRARVPAANKQQEVDVHARKINLLVVSSDTWPPTRVDVSVLFGEELASRGHRIDWILQSEHACDKGYAVNAFGGVVWVGPTDLGSSLLSRVRKHVRGILHDMKLFQRLRNSSYDVIQVKDKFISGLFAIAAAKMYRKRFVYWLSYPFPEDYLLRASDGTARYPFLYVIRGNVFRVLLYRILLPAADHVFVQSEQMRCDVAREGIPLRKMTAVPMGIKPESFAGALRHTEPRVIPKGQRCFLYLGTLRRVRRIDFLVHVLARVRKALPGVVLYLVGSGDDATDETVLRDEAQRCGVADAIVFTGQLPQAEALRYVADADVCVSPFYPTPILNSTSPTKLVEYLAMGKAVVANDHPEQRLVIEESGAGLCVPYEEEPFAAAVIKLLESPELVNSMGEKGRSYATEHRSYAKIANAVESAYQRLVGDGALNAQ